jgi:maltose phosphorylase
MPKLAEKYFKINPWQVIEEGFNPEQGEVSESIFSLSNEYMGIRGYFEEGYTGKSLPGSYINGVYEEKKVTTLHYKGISDRITFMVNTVDWLHTRIKLDGELLDLHESRFTNFVRWLDMKKGLLNREFVWETKTGKRLKVEFQRFLSMVNSCSGYQRIKFIPLNFSGKVEVVSGLDFSLVHRSQPEKHWNCLKKGQQSGITAILSQTNNSNITVYAGFKLNLSGLLDKPGLEYIEKENFVGVKSTLNIEKDEEAILDKKVSLYRQKHVENIDNFWIQGIENSSEVLLDSYGDALKKHTDYWEEVWDKNDIIIKGDEENQQGIRYCIFQLQQTFHGENPGLNIGAKGLTGEVYSGHTFWDTETYCLPFYLFNNPVAAKNLLLFRYRGLESARERARELDCSGACYPVATLDGKESCTLWQHASLQFQPSTGVAYAIWHYHKITNDFDFLYNQGIEMLVEISRFLKDRCQRGQRTGKVGYYGVMGPDEFQMMVNHNCYTNYMAQKTFLFTLEVLEEMKKEASEKYQRICDIFSINKKEIAKWKELATNMYIPQDEETGIYEQHEGFFDLPHIDIDSIPETEFPLYNHWSYDRIYRNDMIKQPDVLMFLFLYNQEFSRETKRVNYEYYEPRCIHESSLSPSIHSILAAELGKKEEASAFFRFATRLDLDNYNRNTNEGLHITSIAAAWMNIVYGFGGMRSDGDILAFKPSIPDSWTEYSFKITYQQTLFEVKVNRDYTLFKVLEGNDQKLKINGDIYLVTSEGIEIANI